MHLRNLQIAAILKMELQRLKYQWNFADPNANAGNPNTSTQKNPEHTYSATGLLQCELIGNF